MVGERVDVVEPHSLASGEELLPGGAPGSGVGGRHQAEVLGSVVGHDEESWLSVSRGIAPVVVDAVLDPVTAGLDHREVALRSVRGERPHLRGDLRVERADEVPVVLGAPDPEVEVLVGLLVHEPVVDGIGAHHVAPELVGTHGRVDPHVEDGAVVVRPRDSVRGVLDRFGRLRSGGEVGEAHRVALGPGGVGRVRQPVVVGTDRQIAEREVLVAFRESVLVDEDHLVARRWMAGPAWERLVFPPGVLRPTTVDAVAAPLDRAAVVQPGTLADRHRQIGLLDARHDLLEERILQGDGRCHHRVGVGVLGLEMGEDRRVVAVAEPVPVVDPHVAVCPELDRASLGDRCLRQLLGWGGIGAGGSVEPGIRPGCHGGRGSGRVLRPAPGAGLLLSG